MKTVEGILVLDMDDLNDIHEVAKVSKGTIMVIIKTERADYGEWTFSVDIAYGGKHGLFHELNKAILFAHALETKMNEED